MAQEMGRKKVKLNRAGGSRSAILPAAWLDRVGIRDEAVLVQTAEGILVAPPSSGTASIEGDPEFASFLDFLAKDAIRHPERLGDIGEFFAGDDELLKGVDPDPD